MQYNSTLVQSEASVLQTNKVIRNTYILLSMTLLFSAFTAFLGVVSGASSGMALGADILALVIAWFVLPKTANSASGIPVIFAFTGLLGYGLGPVLSHYLAIHPQVVLVSLGGTGAIFLALSGYALTTRKDFSFMAGFLMVGLFVVLGAMLLNIFLGFPAFALTIDAAVILIMSGFILFQTSAIIHGGETNYIMATASLFLSILNIFTALLQLLGGFSDD